MGDRPPSRKYNPEGLNGRAKVRPRKVKGRRDGDPETESASHSAVVLYSLLYSIESHHSITTSHHHRQLLPLCSPSLTLPT